MPATKKQAQHAPSTNVTTSKVGLKAVTYGKISPKTVNLRDKAGNAEGEEEEEATDHQPLQQSGSGKQKH